MKYALLSQGLRRNKQMLVPEDQDVYTYIEEQEFKKDWYKSIFLYEEKHQEIFKQTGSLAGVADLMTKKIVFDFDHEENIEAARQDTLTLVERLVEMGVESDAIQLCFSGSKGFSAEVEVEEELTRDEFKNVVFNVGKGLQTLDDSIHDYQRIFRLPFTTHQTSGLYKIPISQEILKEMPITGIKELARDTNATIGIARQWKSIKLTPKLKVLSSTPYEVDTKIISNEAVDIATFKLDLSGCPRWLSPEKYALMQGYIPRSDRNHALMILASTFKSQGFDQEHTFNLLKATIAKREKLLGIPQCKDYEIQRDVVSIIYSPTWRGGTYGKDDPLLATIRDQFGLKGVNGDGILLTNKEMFYSFKDYALNIDKNTIKTGLPIDDYLRLTIGMPVAILGGPSSGKTSCTLNILRNTSLQGIKSMFFSLDMHRALLVQRQIQLTHGHDSDTIFKNIQSPEKSKEYLRRLEGDFSNVLYSCRSGITIDELRAEVESKQRELNGELKLVVIDYLECIHGPYSDPTANSWIISSKIKDIANDLNVCVLLLVQPPKITGGAAYPLNNMYQIKGSSMVAQSMRAIVGIYRVGFTPDDVSKDRYITFVGLKNSMGQLFRVDCHWDGKTGKAREITNPDDQYEVNEMRSMLLNERKSSNEL